ncbi:hypothetical protein AJ80_05355 [Polytolypa hystricis UAMH7299]|uniref:Uncharacterized protein n=1 Tax=Polytolypa hystricis (strain UAMH7299) TaxID=1447883 RepID=A0A2B7Y4A1_POLH7|nr:hypothetical protein AJ80_05355 [Polytolypa hystricis UAMH7299]
MEPTGIPGSSHAATSALLNTNTGDETSNMDVFTHAAGYVITFVGSDNDGAGTEVLFQTTAQGAESIVLKLGKHMIDCGSRWGILFGGNEFMVFYLDELRDGQDIYYHLVVSDRHSTFPQTAPQGTPSLLQVLIALLLGTVSVINYNAPKSSIGTRYPAPSPTTSRSSTSSTASNVSNEGPIKDGN